MSAPRRRVVVKLELEGDSWEDVSRALRQLAFQVDAGQVRRSSVSGGYTTGHVWEADEDETITHESFVAALEAHNAANDKDCER